MRNLPKELLVYVFDKAEDGAPMYAVAKNVAEIPEDIDGQKVGVYTLNRVCGFKVKRALS